MTGAAPICKHRAVPAPGDLASFLADLPIAGRAAAWAAEAHDGQERDVDGAPFVVHLLEVALLLHITGYRDEVVAAGLLHDVVEKGGVEIEAVSEAFGDEIAGIVAALTEDERIRDYHTRKGRLRERAEASGEEVVAVFAADKVAKARELRLAAAADRLEAREVACKRQHYVASLEMLERRLRDHPFTEVLRFELEAHLLVPALAWLRPVAAPAALRS
jgi:(p)ppGpp synthase/HD superfamily hydrolase